jgi:hypothetical protein
MGYATWLSPNQNIDKTTLMTLFFGKVCFVIDTTEHIILKNGEHDMSSIVLWWNACDSHTWTDVQEQDDATSLRTMQRNCILLEQMRGQRKWISVSHGKYYVHIELYLDFWK